MGVSTTSSPFQRLFPDRSDSAHRFNVDPVHRKGNRSECEAHTGVRIGEVAFAVAEIAHLGDEATEDRRAVRHAHFGAHPSRVNLE
jgi:hypothetical protein